MFQFDLYFSDGLKAPSIENYLVSRSSFFLAGPFTCYQRRTVNILGRVPPRKLTWQWNITIFNRKYIFKWLVFHCYAWFSGVYSFWVMLWQGRFFAQIFWTVPLQIPEKRVITCSIIPGLGYVVNNHGDHKSPQDRVVGPHGLFISFYR